MVKFDGLRSRLDRIAWVRYLKQTPVGRAVRRRLRSRVGSGSAYPKWQLRHDPVDVACNLCGSCSSNPVCNNPLGLSIVRCTECGLIYVHRQPATADMRARYDGYMAAERSRQEWDAWMDERERRLDEWGIGEFERALGADRRVLELGCAEGYQLAVFQ